MSELSSTVELDKTKIEISDKMDIPRLENKISLPEKKETPAFLTFPSLSEKKEIPSLSEKKEIPSLSEKKETPTFPLLGEKREIPSLSEKKEIPSLSKKKETPTFSLPTEKKETSTFSLPTGKKSPSFLVPKNETFNSAIFSPIPLSKRPASPTDRTTFNLMGVEVSKESLDSVIEKVRPASPDKKLGKDGTIAPIVKEPVVQSSKAPEIKKDLPTPKPEIKKEPVPKHEDVEERIRSLESIPRSKISIDYLRIPNYDAMTTEQKDNFRAVLKVRYSILSETFPQRHIVFPEGESLRFAHIQYEQFVRQIQIDQEAANYSYYLAIGFAILELIAAQIGLDLSGYSSNQLKKMNRYHHLLVELGEKNTRGGEEEGGWPVEIRLIIVALINAAAVLAINWLIKKLGAPGRVFASEVEKIGDWLTRESPRVAASSSSEGQSSDPIISDIPKKDEEGSFLGSILGGLKDLNISGLINSFATAANHSNQTTDTDGPRRRRRPSHPD